MQLPPWTDSPDARAPAPIPLVYPRPWLGQGEGAAREAGAQGGYRYLPCRPAQSLAGSGQRKHRWSLAPVFLGWIDRDMRSGS